MLFPAVSRLRPAVLGPTVLNPLVCGFALLAAVAGISARAAEPPAKEFTPESIAAAVSASLDLTADPCTDFYRYACGGWLDTNTLPADQPRFGRVTAVREENRRVLREILEAAAANPAGESDQARVGRFYAACLDEPALDREGAAALAPLLAIIAEVDGPERLMRVVGELHRAGVPALFEIQPLPDFKAPSRVIAYYSQGGFGLPERDSYFRDDAGSVEVRKLYAEHVARMLALGGEAAETATATAAKVVAFETELARASRPPVAMRDVEKLYNRLDLPGLEALAPQLPWKVYQEATGKAGVVEISVAVPEFFTALGKLAVDTPPAVLAAYLRWQLLHAMAPSLGKSFVDEDFSFTGKVLSGLGELEPRWKRCADATDLYLGDALGRLFVERRFAGDSKEIALGMIRQVEAAFEANLPALGWMDETTRERAREKVAAITNKIGYPDRWRDTSAFVVGGSHVQNVLAGSRFESARQLGQMGEPVDPNEWLMTAPTLNAYYNPAANEMVFPAGILQPPIFHRDFPAAMGYGAMGAIVGHELTHGFDDTGRKFDATGQLRQWWEPAVEGAFETRAACVRELYSTYEVSPGLKINGELTAGENIADLGGVKASHGALRRQLGDELGQPSIVAGLTNEQLFFVAYGQVWCAHATPEWEALQVRSDVHSHHRYRVIGPLSNLPAFGEAFACRPGQPMRPAKVCEVW